MKLLVLIGVSLAVFPASEGVMFTRCQLVWELRRLAFSEDNLRYWVCLIEYKSGRITSQIGLKLSNGSRDYGLFQINGKYCRSYKSGSKISRIKNAKTTDDNLKCHVDCTELLSDDIRKAANCAKLIFKRYGFGAWYGWKNNCQPQLPDISMC